MVARADAVVAAIGPSSQAEHALRDGVVAYLRDLARRAFAPHAVDAYAFGSVPLRTYLPDGDGACVVEFGFDEL
jgi:hypothetical protein